MKNPQPTDPITAACACGAFSYTWSYPASALPFPRALCLCTTCRKLSGSVGISYINLAKDPSLDPSDYDFDPDAYKLVSYKTSDALTRYFCGTCGAHVAVGREKPEGQGRIYSIATGLWDRTEGVIRWSGCKYVADTLDGGVSIWLRTAFDDPAGHERSLSRWLLQDSGTEVPPSQLRKLKRKEGEGREKERLEGSCHCGGVRFWISRPGEESRKVWSPFPDLMVPYHGSASSANPENETWWLRDNDTKYLAGTYGFEIQPWAFVPKCNIFQGDGEPLDYKFGTLKRYDSSEGVWREFCGTCGATVFWHCAERPDLVDVSAGLLDPEEGARAEGWLDWWTKRVSFREMAVSKSLVDSLELGLMSADDSDL
ncbi:hypothetical protein B0O99DRAFT_691155 [Bisporella sp. PMI_857]|nr:hypothetical protein B0O99DRAFT_691155 [Bisporella sp. PMI_857]